MEWYKICTVLILEQVLVFLGTLATHIMLVHYTLRFTHGCTGSLMTPQETQITRMWHVTSPREDAGQSKEHRQVYDVVVSRAVAHLPVLLELATPLVKVGGRFVAYKGSEAETELAESKRATKLLRVDIEQVFEIELPKQMGRRSILVFRKTAATPPTYPRKAGIPNKQPLV